MPFKKSLSILILFITLTILLFSACSSKNAKSKLSELDDNALTQYMTDAGISIPENVDMDTIRRMITELENNPDHEAPSVGYTPIADLYEDLRDLVVEYKADK